MSNIVPVLSGYEKNKINLDQSNPLFLEYVTGLQKWSMNEKNLFVRTARKNQQHVIAGPSGHTDAIFSSSVYSNATILKSQHFYVFYITTDPSPK